MSKPIKCTNSVERQWSLSRKAAFHYTKRQPVVIKVTARPHTEIDQNSLLTPLRKHSSLNLSSTKSNKLDAKSPQEYSKILKALSPPQELDHSREELFKRLKAESRSLGEQIKASEQQWASIKQKLSSPQIPFAEPLSQTELPAKTNIGFFNQSNSYQPSGQYSGQKIGFLQD